VLVGIEPIVKIAECNCGFDKDVVGAADRVLTDLVTGATFFTGFAAGITNARLPNFGFWGVCFIGTFLSCGNVGSSPGTRIIVRSSVDSPGALIGNEISLELPAENNDGEESSNPPNPTTPCFTGITFPPPPPPGVPRFPNPNFSPMLLKSTFFPATRRDSISTLSSPPRCAANFICNRF